MMALAIFLSLPFFCRISRPVRGKMGDTLRRVTLVLFLSGFECCK